MKKIISFLILIIFLVTGCSSSSDIDDAITRCVNDASLDIMKGNCYWFGAVAAKDYDICEKIEIVKGEGFPLPEGYEMDARPLCYLFVAVEKRDVAKCETFNRENGDSDYCYSEIAIAKKDKSICEKSGASYERCINLIDNPSQRETIDKKDKFGICEMINTESTKGRCLRFLELAS